LQAGWSPNKNAIREAQIVAGPVTYCMQMSSPIGILCICLPRSNQRIDGQDGNSPHVLKIRRNAATGGMSDKVLPELALPSGTRVWLSRQSAIQNFAAVSATVRRRCHFVEIKGEHHISCIHRDRLAYAKVLKRRDSVGRSPAKNARLFTTP
jgi:hypothetical protein